MDDSPAKPGQGWEVGQEIPGQGCPPALGARGLLSSPERKPQMSEGLGHLSQGQVLSSKLGHTNIPQSEPHLLQGLCHQNGPGWFKSSQTRILGGSSPIPLSPCSRSIPDNFANHSLQIICKSSAVSQKWHLGARSPPPRPEPKSPLGLARAPPAPGPLQTQKGTKEQSRYLFLQHPSSG